MPKCSKCDRVSHRRWCEDCQTGPDGPEPPSLFDEIEALIEAEPANPQPEPEPMPTPAEAQAKGAAGLAKAVAHSGEDWQGYAQRFLQTYCETHELVFCDDIWDAGLEVPASKRAFGQCMKTAIRNGWIEPTGESRKSVMSNKAPRTVYRSLILS